MNLVQLAEHAKNLSNEQLQKMLQQPDGSVPPFILASEAARRQDIEQSAQMQPSQPTTVLDDLIKGRADKAGVAQLAGQMAQPQQAAQPQMARGGGLMSLANGGQVRGFAGGSVAVSQPPSGVVMPMPSLSDIAAGLGQEFTGAVDWAGQEFAGAVDWAKQKYDILNTPVKVGVSGSTDPFVRQSAGLGPVQPSGGLTAEEYTADVDRYRRELAGGYSRKTVPNQKEVDPEAVDKNLKTADKEAEMGAKPTATSPPTTENSVDTEAVRAQIEALYGPQDDNYILGISPVAYAGIAKAMLSSEPGLSSGERWANASMALAAGQQSKAERDEELRREGAMALLNYDMKEADRIREDQIRQTGYDREDRRYQQALDAQAAKDLRAEKDARNTAYLDGIKTQSETYKVMSDRAGKDMENIAQKYQGNHLGIKAWTPEDIQRYKELEAAQKSYYGQYIYFQNELSGAKGVKFKVSETIDPNTGRPIPMPP